MADTSLKLSVSEFVALTNQTLEYAYPSIEVEGEVASFKVSQGKYVFFDLKDGESTVNCFMSLFQLRIAIEDGMKVVVTASPKLTQWGRFSLTVRQIRPSGEGALRKSFELLKKKLELEGLFAPERKRTLPYAPQHVGVISSTQAAGYADFVKILNDRWGGVRVDVAHVQVQGDVAADQIIRALEYFNTQSEVPDVLVLIRGGGSADDLSAFNDEQLVRAIASSRIPVLTGIGHEVDESLADLAADVRAATPSNAAQLLVPDRMEVRREVSASITGLLPRIEREIAHMEHLLYDSLRRAIAQIDTRVQDADRQLEYRRQQLEAYNPRRVLERGYAMMRGDPQVGAMIVIETQKTIIEAEVQHVTNKEND